MNKKEKRPMEELQRYLQSFIALSPQQCVESLPNLTPFFAPSSVLSGDSLLEALLQLWATHPTHGKVLFDAFSWDIWDLLHHRTLFNSQDRNTEADWPLQAQATWRLSESVSTKEFRLMFFEKMDTQNWTYSGVKWICYVFQLLLVGSGTAQSTENCVKASRGMFAVFHAFIQSHAETEPGHRKSILSHLCYDVVHMLTGVASLSTSWAACNASVRCSVKEADRGLHRLLLQFLYAFTADVALLQLESDIDVRDAWCSAAVALLLCLLDHQMQDVLNFHRQIGFEVQQQLKAQQTSSMRANSKPQGEPSKVLEMVQTDCRGNTNVCSSLKKCIHAHSPRNVIAQDELIPTEMLLNHLHAQDCLLLDGPSKEQPVVGLVFLLQHWLYYVLRPTTSSSKAYPPLGLRRDWLEESYQAVLRCLLSIDKLAAQEGLRALLCLYPTRGRQEDLLAFLPSAGCGRIFLSSCLTLTFDELQQDYARLLLRPNSVGCEEGVNLGLLCMQSAQTWHTTQCIVTAITMCQDVPLRSQAFHAWKCYLVQFEGWSVFELLFQLLKKCPYESMRAMLFEVVKVFVQLHAHPQLQASSAHSPHLQMSTEARTKVFKTSPSRANDIVGALRIDNIFDVRSVVSRYSSLSTLSFHQAVFAASNGHRNTVCYSLLAVEYFVLHFMRDCCLESFAMNSNLLEEVNVQVNILQFIFSKLLATSQSDEKLLDSFFAMHMDVNQNLDLHGSQVLLDLLVVLDAMQKQLRDRSVEVEEIDRLKAELLQVNLTMAEEKVKAVITGLLSC